MILPRRQRKRESHSIMHHEPVALQRLLMQLVSGGYQRARHAYSCEYYCIACRTPKTSDNTIKTPEIVLTPLCVRTRQLEERCMWSGSRGRTLSCADSKSTDTAVWGTGRKPCTRSNSASSSCEPSRCGKGSKLKKNSDSVKVER